MRTDVYWIPGPWPGRLGILPRPRGGDWLRDEVHGWREAGVEVVASLLMPEEIAELGLQDEAARCREEGLNFRTFPIPDREVPESRARAVELIRELEQALRSGKSVAVHCRQGIGRSGLIAASLLVAAGANSDDAFRSVEQARGAPVPDTPAQREWVQESPFQAPAAIAPLQ